MKILVIEDTDYKFEEIKGYLTSLEETDITRMKSRNGGLIELRDSFRKIDKTPYDLLILDMVIPLYEDDSRKLLNDGGKSILSEIERCGWPIPVCICSSDSYDSEKEKLCEEYGVLKYIEYNSSVWLEPQFKEALIAAKNKINKPETTYVMMYHSFGENSLKKCESRREALDYMAADIKEELRIITKENGKVEGKDFTTDGNIYEEEYFKLSYLNGDIIEWSIPEII